MSIYKQQGQNGRQYDYCKEMIELINSMSQRESSLSKNEVNMIHNLLENKQLVIKTQLSFSLIRLKQILVPEDPLRIKINKILGSEVEKNDRTKQSSSFQPQRRYYQQKKSMQIILETVQCINNYVDLSDMTKSGKNIRIFQRIQQLLQLIQNEDKFHKTISPILRGINNDTNEKKRKTVLLFGVRKYQNKVYPEGFDLSILKMHTISNQFLGMLFMNEPPDQFQEILGRVQINYVEVINVVNPENISENSINEKNSKYMVRILVLPI